MTGENNRSTNESAHSDAASRIDRCRPRSLGLLAWLGALLLTSLGLVALGGAGPATAHTPSISATCEKLTVNLTNYQGSGAPNTVRVVIDGATRTETSFGSSYAQVFTLGDPATSHTWSVAVTASDDPDGSRGWTISRTGTTTPCAPPDACPDLPGDQPPGTSCTQPGDEMEVRWLHGAPDCTTHTVTSTKQSRSRTYSWNGTSWAPGPWSAWTTVKTTTTPTTPEQCPATQVTAAAPTYSPPDCSSAPSLSYAPGDGYHWTLSGPPEARVLTAVAEDNRTLVGQTVFGPYDTTPWTAEERAAHGCVAELAEPVVIPSAGCGALAAITPPTGKHLAYTISGGRWSDLAAGDYLVTATLTDGATEFGNALGWQVQGRTATRVVHIDPARTCVTPDVQVTSAACVPGSAATVVGGRITVPAQEGVTYQVRDAAGAVLDPTATTLAPGTYVVTATPAAGYEVADANGFVDGSRTVEIPATAISCAAVSVPIRPAVRAVDRCYTSADRVVFDRDNQYWTASITDDSHVTFIAKGDHRFRDESGNPVDRLVLAYPPLTDEQCPLTPGGVGASCVGSVPYLSYALDLPRGFETNDPRPLTITFVNPDGADHRISGLPLTGRVLWPGASATPPLMWPGWDLVDGQYVEVGDERFGWTRDGITVRFQVNPEYSTTLEYPPATVACANPPTTTRTPGTPWTGNPPAAFRPPTGTGLPPLPNTGGPSSTLLGLGGLLLTAGCAMVWQARRTRPVTD